MTTTGTPGSVVVGIDGSRAALAAARWAVDEALKRDVPLRLVHATDTPAVAAVSREDYGLTIEYADDALRVASTAIDAIGRDVKIETAIHWGNAAAVLIDESVSAAMVCVGSVGIGRAARLLLGSTAAALAEGAHCPVAIIRSGVEALPVDSGFIAVTVSDDFDNDAVVGLAMEEARLRSAPVLALRAWPSEPGGTPNHQLHRRLTRWVDRYPDVHVQPAAAHHGVAAYLESTDEPIRFVVVGRADADNVARCVGPHNRPGCSVLAVRQW